MDTNLNRSDDYQGFCGLDSWGPWKNYDFTNCFREAVIDAGIPLLYTIGSKCILILAYVKYKRQKSPIHEPLISGQTNASYGSIGSVDSEETSITNDADSESTLLTNEFPKNKMFDWCRLLFGMSMFTLFCFFVIFRWREYDENKQGLYLITSPIIEGLIWSYASLLAYINLKSQYRNQFYLRKHLDILYFITFVSSIINIHSFYLQYGTKINIDYSFGLWTLIISFILVMISIMEPEDDPEGLLLKPNSEVLDFWECQTYYLI